MKTMKLSAFVKYALPCMVLTCAGLGITRPSTADPVLTVHVAGAVAKPTDWTNAQLTASAAGPVVSIAYTLKGVSHVSHCVSLLDVIKAALPNFNPHIKHHDLQFIVAVQGIDGYTVDFSLAELLPELGNHPVWIALDEDGKPLADETGPAELVVKDDVKPGRWVHGIASITIVDGAK